MIADESDAVALEEIPERLHDEQASYREFISTASSGAGLELAIAHHMARGMGGGLEAEPVPPEGARSC